MTSSNNLFIQPGKWKSLVLSAGIILSLFGAHPVLAKGPAQPKSHKSISAEERASRLEHARELLGKYYKRSVVKTGEHVKKINNMIYRWTYEQLPKHFKKRYKKVAQTIIDASLKYDFDPVFVASVISNESSFNPQRLGKAGEIGLMQILPSTGKWIARRSHIRWHGKRTLYDPVTNIKIGAAFLDYLRNEFDSQARLYLAAYNMGQGNVHSALDRNIWPKDYPLRVMRRYISYYRQIRDDVASN